MLRKLHGFCAGQLGYSQPACSSSPSESLLTCILRDVVRCISSAGLPIHVSLLRKLLDSIVSCAADNWRGDHRYLFLVQRLFTVLEMELGPAGLLFAFHTHVAPLSASQLPPAALRIAEVLTAAIRNE